MIAALQVAAGWSAGSRPVLEGSRGGAERRSDDGRTGRARRRMWPRSTEARGASTSC